MSNDDKARWIEKITKQKSQAMIVVKSAPSNSGIHYLYEGMCDGLQMAINIMNEKDAYDIEEVPYDTNLTLARYQQKPN